MTGSRLVVIEDDRDIAELVRSALADAGFAVETYHDGESGLAAAVDADVDLVVLDLMLPGMDGLEVCRRLRAVRPEARIVMLTAKTAEIDLVVGLELGADDYVTKPFSLRELQARVKALLRRRDTPSGGVPAGRLTCGSLAIDVAGQSVGLRGEAIELTQREFDLLVLLAQHEGTVFTREELLDRVWGAGFDGFAHTVNSHINRLRGKIERDPAHPELIRTVWGRGYKLVAPD